MTTLYHGSFVSVESPLVGVGRRELDFGPGFYVTTLREQAERWARRVCVVRAVNTPVISIYQFDEESLPNDIRRIYLEHYDLRWLDSKVVLLTTKLLTQLKIIMLVVLQLNKPLDNYVLLAQHIRCAYGIR